MIAPAARTFLHVIYGRLGSSAHLILCTFALLNSLYVVATTIETSNRLFPSISTEITFDLLWIIAITIAGICVSCDKYCLSAMWAVDFSCSRLPRSSSVSTFSAALPN
ncbi:urea active transporter 1 [Echinococcus multilocularis]|uniref:Urea active transporter 1 n=1 Tax=Echinococcus multilocularis TaxID=6211 RepID=A0A0S4MJG9_ECHMU|nr:urea active transporter 1 [Echinococcus multilocularis]